MTTMPELVDSTALNQAVEHFAGAVAALAAQAGGVPVIRRLQNDVERLRLDAADCSQLAKIVPARQLEVIPDTPYDQSMWRDVDDEGLGGFRQEHKPAGRSHHHHR